MFSYLQSLDTEPIPTNLSSLPFNVESDVIYDFCLNIKDRYQNGFDFNKMSRSTLLLLLLTKQGLRIDNIDIKILLDYCLKQDYPLTDDNIDELVKIVKKEKRKHGNCKEITTMLFNKKIPDHDTCEEYECEEGVVYSFHWGKNLTCLYQHGNEQLFEIYNYRKNPADLKHYKNIEQGIQHLEEIFNTV